MSYHHPVADTSNRGTAGTIQNRSIRFSAVAPSKKGSGRNPQSRTETSGTAFHMSRILNCILTACVAASLLLSADLAKSQELTRGFERVAPAIAGGEELLLQPQLWIYETQLKKMRMIRVDVKDPKTGKVSREWIWYLVYRVINRDLNRPADSSDTTPVNDNDPQPEEIFMPEFLLATTDGDGPKFYSDTVLPDVQAEVMRRERISSLKNPIEIIGPVAASSPDGEDDNAIYGVAIWRGVDPKTDNFTLYLSGFSNGYRIGKGPDGEPVRLRKTITQDFWRPGDEFEQDEVEIRFKGDISWLYRVDPPRDNPIPIERPADE